MTNFIRPGVNVSNLVWTGLLPKLVSILELNRAQRLEERKKVERQARRSFLHMRLQVLKSRINPFHDLLGDLGFDMSYPLSFFGNIPAQLRSLVDYPFPNFATAVEWPCLQDIETLDFGTASMQTMLQDRQEAIKNEIDKWRNDGEQELVNMWGGGTAATLGEGTPEVLTVSG